MQIISKPASFATELSISQYKLFSSDLVR